MINFDLKQRISKNFTLGELVGHRQDNLPENLSQLINLVNITTTILQPLRDNFGKILVTSGRRSREYNKSIGGKITSQHILGEAVDIQCADADIEEVFKFAIYNLKTDQIIFEEKGSAKWLHISLRIDKNRGDVLRYKNGQYSSVAIDSHVRIHYA